MKNGAAGARLFSLSPFRSYKLIGESYQTKMEKIVSEWLGTTEKTATNKVLRRYYDTLVGGA